MQCAGRNSRIEHIQVVTRLVMAFGTLLIKLANSVSVQEYVLNIMRGFMQRENAW